MTSTKGNLEQQYITYFRSFFEQLITSFYKHRGYKIDDELSLSDSIIYDALTSLPCPLGVIRLYVDTNKHCNAKNTVYNIIKFDFTRLGKSNIEYWGETSYDELNKNKDLIEKLQISEDDAMKIIDQNYISFYDYEPWQWVWILSYDILEKLDHFIFEFIENFISLFWHIIQKKFNRIPDFNKKYNLKRDVILSQEYLLKKDSH